MTQRRFMQIQKPRFGGAFSYLGSDALYTFKSRGLGGETGVDIDP